MTLTEFLNTTDIDQEKVKKVQDFIQKKYPDKKKKSDTEITNMIKGADYTLKTSLNSREKLALYNWIEKKYLSEMTNMIDKDRYDKTIKRIKKEFNINLRKFLNETLDLTISEEEKMKKIIKEIEANYRESEIESLVLMEIRKTKVPASAKKSSNYIDKNHWIDTQVRPQAVDKVFDRIIKDEQKKLNISISYSLRDKISNKLQQHYDQEGT